MSARSVLISLVLGIYFFCANAWIPISQQSTLHPVIALSSVGARLPLQHVLSVSSVDTNVELSAGEKLPKLPTPEPPKSQPDLELDFKDKVINAIFLSASFGYALYTIFSIDQGITRGWTASEIAMRIPLDNWGAYESYLANKPVVTKTLINVIIYLLGDWLSQTAFKGKNVLEFDIKRTLRNGFIGLCFGPLVHEYYQFSDTILPPEEGIITRLEKIVMDQTIYLTVKCSIYISAVGLLGGDDWETVQQSVKDKIVGIVFTAWKFWPLVHCITYGLIPARHRILWVNSVDLVWNAILASKAAKQVDVVKEEESKEDAIVVEAEELQGGSNTTFFFDTQSSSSLEFTGNPPVEPNGTNSTMPALAT
jgi:protein Mpv17